MTHQPTAEHPPQIHISSSPIDAIMPDTALVVGYQDGRLYLGARYNNTHVHLAPEAHAEAARTWATGGSPHLFARGWTEADICRCNPEQEEQP